MILLAVRKIDPNKTKTIENVVHYPFEENQNKCVQTQTFRDSITTKLPNTMSNFYSDEFSAFSEKCISQLYDLSYNMYQDGHKYNTSDYEVGENMSNINWQEKYIENLNDNIKEIKEGFINTENRIADMINKHIEYSTHLDNQRHDELLNLNNKIDSSIDSINEKIDSTNKWIIGLAISTILGIAAMVLTVILT